MIPCSIISTFAIIIHFLKNAQGRELELHMGEDQYSLGLDELRSNLTSVMKKKRSGLIIIHEEPH